MRLVFILCSVGLVSRCVPGLAQDQTAPESAPSAYTTVSGHVTCGDTGKAARFAAVQLIPEKPQQPQTSDWTKVRNGRAMAMLMEKSMAEAQKGTGLSAVTTIDGRFEMPKVPAGTYYIVAELSGYLSPLSALSTGERMMGGADALKKIQAQADKIVVQSAPVRADVRLERGGSISGLIRYDDGSPAAGVKPVRMVLQENGKWVVDTFNPTVPATTSDDRGQYRISGLAKGKYAVKAELPTVQSISGIGAGSFNMHQNLGDALVIYSGGVLRERDIKPIEVGAGEDIVGIDLIFPVDDLHLVSGTVMAKTDGHLLNSAWVSLIDADSKETLRRTRLEHDGTFQFNYVPEGRYELSTNHAGDTDRIAPEDALVQMVSPKFLKTYQDATIPIEVKGDLTSLSVQVADLFADAPAKPPTP